MVRAYPWQAVAGSARVLHPSEPWLDLVVSTNSGFCWESLEQGSYCIGVIFGPTEVFGEIPIYAAKTSRLGIFQTSFNKVQHQQLNFSRPRESYVFLVLGSIVYRSRSISLESLWEASAPSLTRREIMSVM